MSLGHDKFQLGWLHFDRNENNQDTTLKSIYLYHPDRCMYVKFMLTPTYKQNLFTPCIYLVQYI